MQPMIITGLGLVTPFGIGYELFIDKLFATSTVAFSFGRAANEFSWRNCLSDRSASASASRAAAMMFLAADEALKQCGTTNIQHPPTALIACTRAGTVRADLADMAPEWLGNRFTLFRELFGEKIRVLQVSAACASVGYAVGIARDLLALRRVERVVVIGAEGDIAPELAGMRAVRALSEGAPKPFDEERSGTALGEGAGCIILEPCDQSSRGLAKISGIGTITDAQDRTQSSVRGLSLAMKDALNASRLSTVNMIQAHATGTVQGDIAEAKAIKEVFEGSVPVTSHKGAIGHLLYASGFPGVAAAIGAIARQSIPGTAGLNRVDPGIRNISLSKFNKSARLDHVMVNMSGFYGHNASIVITKV